MNFFSYVLHILVTGLSVSTAVAMKYEELEEKVAENFRDIEYSTWQKGCGQFNLLHFMAAHNFPMWWLNEPGGFISCFYSMHPEKGRRFYDVPDKKTKCQGLHYAALYGNEECIHELHRRIDRGKDGEGYFTSVGLSPLHCAAYKGYKECFVKLLDYIRFSPALRKKSGDGLTIMHFAVLSGNCELIEYILRKSNEKNFEFLDQCIEGDVNGITPLHLAAFKDNVEIKRTVKLSLTKN